MTYGYARCSTNEDKQDINRQIHELKAAGADEVVFEYEHGDAKVKKELHMLLDTLGYKPLSDGSRDDDGNVRILFRKGRSRIVLVKDITRNHVTLFADQAFAQSGLLMNARNAKEERRTRVRRCLGILLNEIREPNEVLVEALNDYIEGRSNIEELESKLENKE